MRILVLTTNTDVEAAALLVSDLDDHDHRVRCVHDSKSLAAAQAAAVPEVLVACLDGGAERVLEVLARLTEDKPWRGVPVLFTGGDGSGFEAAQKCFPKANFARRDALLNAIASLNA